MAERYLLFVMQERSTYKHEGERSREKVHAHFWKEEVSTNAITGHYSFDFAQQVHYCSSPLQTDTFYLL